jgi:hypothetical protein
MTQKKCTLCKINIANKKNSHIIPKFLCKGLFTTHSRHTLVINRNGKTQKRQDTPKESYIFCVVCEKRMEVLETL